MKRHEALEQLSRDHHQALFQAMRLKRAGEDDAGTVLADFLASAMNPNCTQHQCAPAYVEVQTLDWLKSMLGFSTAAGASARARRPTRTESFAPASAPQDAGRTRTT